MWDKKEIGIRIRELRKNNNMTVIDLAKNVKISQPYLSQIELGKQSVPIDVLIKICNELGISIEQFFSEGKGVEEINQVNKMLDVVSRLNEDEMDALYKFLKLITNR